MPSEDDASWNPPNGPGFASIGQEPWPCSWTTCHCYFQTTFVPPSLKCSGFGLLSSESNPSFLTVIHEVPGAPPGLLETCGSWRTVWLSSPTVFSVPADVNVHWEHPLYSVPEFITTPIPVISLYLLTTTKWLSSTEVSHPQSCALRISRPLSQIPPRQQLWDPIRSAVLSFTSLPLSPSCPHLSRAILTFHGHRLNHSLAVCHN